MRWIENITQWLQNIIKQPSTQDQSVELVTKLMRMLQVTQTQEASCDEVYELVDQYTELVTKGEDAAKLMPLIKHHLDMCADCREEFDALLRILEAVPS